MKIIVPFILNLFLFSCGAKEKDFLVTYYEDGSIEYLIPKKDTSQADRVYFYKTGELLGFEKYKDGKKHGVSRFFYPSGNTKSNWLWYEGHPDGYCYNYGDSYEGYPMEFLVYGGEGQLVLRMKYDSTGKLVSQEGKIPESWDKK